MNQTPNRTHGPMVSFFALALTALATSACTTTSVDTPHYAPTDGQPITAAFLTGQQFTDQIAGTTLVGRIPNWPGAGPIQFKAFYAADGTLADVLIYERGNTTGRDTGIWRVKDDPQGIICYRYRKRFGGSETCFRFRLSEDGRFEQVFVDEPGRTIVGRVVDGDQTK